jgi:isochorismate hydrolase
MPVLIWTFWGRDLTLAPARIQTVECLGHSTATILTVLSQLLYPAYMLSNMRESMAPQGICSP